jgi:glycosyltransferase involved in cell wall biosynthesis
MRIAVWHNLGSGGAHRAMSDQVHGLMARGHEVAVWSPPAAAPLQPPANEQRVPLAERRKTTLPGRVADVLRGKDRLYERHLAHAQACANAINDGKFDVLLAHPCVEQYAPCIGGLVDCPSVLYLQEPNRHLFEFGDRSFIGCLEGGRGLKPRLARHLAVVEASEQARREAVNARCYARVLTNSYFSCESITRAYGLTAWMARLGVDLCRFPHVERHRPVERAISVGALVPGKGVDFIIRAVAASAGVRQLTWVANFAHRDFATRMHHLAAGLGVDFTLRLQVSDAELVQELHASDVFLFAATLEPLGLAPLEGAATGLPVVAVNEAGPRESLPPECLSPRDVFAFAKSIDRLSADRSAARVAGLAARRHVQQNWDLQQALSGLESMLAEIVLTCGGRSGR